MKNTNFFSLLSRQLIIISLFYLLSPFALLYSQNGKANSIPEALIDSPENLRAMQEKFNAFCESENIVKGVSSKNGREEKIPNWKLFKRWEHYWEQRVNPETGEFPKTTSIAEFEKAGKELKKTNGFAESWVNLGSSSSTGGYAGLGRINCVAFHPTDNNTFWVGSPSGGIWRTTNGGTNWSILNNNQAVIGVSSIGIPSDFTTSNTIYIATGDRDGGSGWSLGGGQAADNASIGILKSTNGGTTWVATGLTYSTSSGKLIYKLLIHPANAQLMFAATTDGIMKSTDGGNTWSNKLAYKCADIEFNPLDPTIIYGSSFGYTSTYVLRTTDSGENWAVSATISNGRRGELAVSANDPTVVYLFAANSSGGVMGVYKSTNSGTSFAQVNTNTSQAMMGYYSDGSGANTGQGSYDICIAASPTDVNTLFIGGVNNWKSTDGGITWTICSMWTSSGSYNFVGAPEVHADKHVLAFRGGSTLFEGNDGGIYKTTNGGTTWIDLTNGIIISQIYRIGISKTDATKVLTGLQDNGSKKYSGGVNTWTDVYGGDGMECIIDNNNATSYMYVTYVQGQIYRNTNGFSSLATTKITANITGGQPAGAWVTPYIMDPTNSAILYAGFDKVWKTADRGNTWTSASQQLSASTKLRSLAVAPSNTNVMYAADLTHLWKTIDGGATDWTAVTLPTTSASVTYIAVKNNDPNTLWITYGGYLAGTKIFESTNGGTTWTNISTGLANLPVMCVVQHKNILDRNLLFVGTDVGIYQKDGANDWVNFNTGLPNVLVTELEIFYGSGTDKLRAGTFGRGLWETDLTPVLPVELTAFTARQVDKSIILDWNTATELQCHSFDIERGEKTNAGNPIAWKKVGFVLGSGTTNIPHAYAYNDKTVKTSGTYLYRLKQIDLNGSFYYSPTVELNIELPNLYALEQNYPNPFNPSTSINYQIAEDGVVIIKVYDILGNEVLTLVNEKKAAGYYKIEFNAKNFASGVYYYKLNSNGFTDVKKLVVIK